MKPKPNPKLKLPTMATPSPTAESPSDFCFVVARIAVSQICQSVGFNSTQLSALETLTHVATKYLQAIAKASASFATAANRSDSNIFDLSNALRDLRTCHGLSGSSDAHQPNVCLLKSADLSEIAAFVNYEAETPFARPIPRRLDLEKVAVDNVRRNSGAAHVPNWLPEIPEAGDECGVLVSRSGEEFWENRLERSGTNGVDVVENGDIKVGNLELGEERERVRFKIGVNLKSGICKRGGKRVRWNNHRNRNVYGKDYISVEANEDCDNGKRQVT